MEESEFDIPENQLLKSIIESKKEDIKTEYCESDIKIYKFQSEFMPQQHLLFMDRLY